MMKKLWIWGLDSLIKVALRDDSGSSHTKFCNYNNNHIVGATMSDFGLPWDLLAEIDFLV